MSPRLFLVLVAATISGFSAGACLRFRFDAAVEAVAPRASVTEGPVPTTLDVISLRRSVASRVAWPQETPDSGDWICWYPLDVEEREPRPPAFEGGLFR